MSSHRFRWVVCQLDRLRRCQPDRIRSLLADLRESPDRAYELDGTSREGHLEVSRELVDRGADINARERNDWSPPCISTSNGHLGDVNQEQCAGGERFEEIIV